jgi:hypothetical protein
VRSARLVARVRDEITYKIIVGKPETNSHGRPGHGLEDITLYRREMGWEVMDLIHVADDRDQWWVVVHTVISLLVLNQLCKYWLLKLSSAP